MKKIYHTWQDVERQCAEILRQLSNSEWRPNYVVGLTRGGLVPANLISQYLDCPMETLKVSLRDSGEPESNLWMAEDAFGYVVSEYPSELGPIAVEGLLGGDNLFDYNIRAKNILIVDDINDSGNTLNWIKQDWQSNCLPGHVRWDNVWSNNVRVATLYDNESSKSELNVDYSAVTINKAAEDVWIVFPWEEFWKK